MCLNVYILALRKKKKVYMLFIIVGTYFLAKNVSIIYIHFMECALQFISTAVKMIGLMLNTLLNVLVKHIIYSFTLF